MELPDELVEALSQHPNGMKLPARFEDGHGLDPVTFYKLDGIQEVTLFVSVDEYIENYDEASVELRGNYYPVSALDLLEDVPAYRAFGVFVWLPELGEFATYDDDHCVLRSFPGIAWNDIISSPQQFINCSWHPDRVDNHLIRPWSDRRFEKVKWTKEPKW